MPTGKNYWTLRPPYSHDQHLPVFCRHCRTSRTRYPPPAIACSTWIFNSKEKWFIDLNRCLLRPARQLTWPTFSACHKWYRCIKIVCCLPTLYLFYLFLHNSFRVSVCVNPSEKVLSITDRCHLKSYKQFCIDQLKIFLRRNMLLKTPFRYRHIFIFFPWIPAIGYKIEQVASTIL